MADLEALKRRLQQTWAAGDFSMIATQQLLVGELLCEAVDVHPGQRVLDIATGRGAVLFPAAQRVGPSGRAIGIDLSEGMVQATAAEISRRGLTHVEIHCMDAEQLAFPPHSFDAVLCGFGIRFLPQLSHALSGF